MRMDNLTQEDLMNFKDCLVKANDKYLKYMLIMLESEIEKRAFLAEKNSFKVVL